MRALLWRHAPWVALLALVLLAYLPALRAGYVWDDPVLTENPLITSPDGLWHFWAEPSRNVHESHYWPVVYSTFWFEYRLWGLRPLGYHLDNILLHGLCAVLLWRLLRRLEVPGAWLGAALFALHPVHAESVAWVIERKDVLSGAFCLGAALAYWEFDASRRHGSYAAALALFALALLSKSSVIVLPFALALALWWKHGWVEGRRLLPLAPMAAMVAGITLFDLSQFYRLSTSSQVPLSALDRLQIAGRAFWFYPQKLVWPHPLVALYPKWQIDAASLGAWLPHAGALALVGALWAGRRRFGRGPFVAVALYAVSIAPVLGLLKHGFLDFAWVADRFQYLPSIGLLALAGAGLSRLDRAAFPRIAARAVPGALLAALGALTFQQAGFYRDYASLFRHNVAMYPDNWRARCQLSTGLSREGRLAEAAAELEQVIRCKPDLLHTYVLGLATMQARMDRVIEASNSFEAALALKPDFQEGQHEFACFLAKQDQVEPAIRHFLAAIRLAPNAPDAPHNLGCLLGKQDRPVEAAKWLREAVRLAPGNPVYRSDLAMALWHSGAPGEAVEQLEEALRLDPGLPEAHATLGLVQLERGAPEMAIPHLELALSQPAAQPAYLHFKLGEAYRLRGRTAEAIEQYGAALRLQPDFPEASTRLAACQDKLGQTK